MGKCDWCPFGRATREVEFAGKTVHVCEECYQAFRRGQQEAREDIAKRAKA